VQGPVIAPGDERYEQARRPWNAAVDQRPDAVVVATDVDDIVSTVALAADRKVSVAVQVTGHGAATSLAGTVLLSTGGLRELSIDPVRRTARVGPGVLWQELQQACAPHGLSGLAGTAPRVGVIGYTISGGLGLMARRHGLAAHRVLAAELVTGDGQHLRVDHDHHPDLWWALRGGGTPPGVVTALEIGLVPVPQLCAGQLTWPADVAQELVAAYRSWTTTVPDELTSMLAIRELPPLPQVPEPLRGQRVVTLTVAHLGAEDEVRRLARPLTDLAHPVLDTVTARLPDDLDVAGVPAEPVPTRTRTELLTDLLRAGPAGPVRPGSVGLAADDGRTPPPGRGADDPAAGPVGRRESRRGLPGRDARNGVRARFPRAHGRGGGPGPRGRRKRGHRTDPAQLPHRR